MNSDLNLGSDGYLIVVVEELYIEVSSLIIDRFLPQHALIAQYTYKTLEKVSPGIGMLLDFNLP